ncbi:MAG: HigA family addiction module antidote protein [Treponema sp.]|jgi:addiction module HigA family antidote|nr:HigA family addiction module antidote protein [Treponema sp.]
MAKTAVLVPGTVLKGLLESYHISVAKISEDIGLSPSAVRQLVNNKLKISTIIALRLAKYFDKKPEYWIGLQANYELLLLQKDAGVTAALKTVPKAQKQPAPAPKKAARPAAARKPAAPRAGAKSAAKKPAAPKAGAKPAAKKPAAPKAGAKPAAARKPAAPKAKPAAAPAPVPAE